MKNATSTIQGFVWQFRHDHVMRRRMLFVLMALSLVVGLSVFYGLRHTALTLAGTADCGLAEHVHSAECVQQTLICGLEEEAAEAAETAEAAEGASENAGDAAPTGHTHSDACYETTYTCGFAADYEHVHMIECYADELADVETADVWEATLEPARSQLSGTWAADVVAIAQTQLGYAESTRNWQLDEAGARQGYTRFGAWYGSPYVEWSSAFASFVLAYAGIGEDVLPYGSGAHSWAVELDNDGLYAQAADHTPQAGDVVFIDTDADGQADRSCIVEAVAADGALTTIEGDVDGAVARVTYPADAATAGRTNAAGEPLATILGYLPTAQVQVEYAVYQQEQQAAEGDSVTNPDDPTANPDDPTANPDEPTANADSGISLTSTASSAVSNGEVEVVALKTLDGATPGKVNGEALSFNFVLKDSSGNQVATAASTASGSITFKFTAPTTNGTYTYTMEETSNGGDYTYDTTPKTVQVTISSGTTASYTTSPYISSSSTITGHEEAMGSSGADLLVARHVEINGTNYPAFCISTYGGYSATGDYDYIIEPTEAQLTAAAAPNTPISGAKEKLRKLVHFFSVTKGTSAGSYTFNQAQVSALFWYITGDSSKLSAAGIASTSVADAMISAITSLSSERNVSASNYALILLRGQTGDSGWGQQPLVMGATVNYTTTKKVASQSTVPTFANTTGASNTDPDPGTDPDPTTETVSIQIKATKEFTGGTLSGGDFTFTLYASDQTTVLGTATNDANGTITFNAITLDAVAGTHTFYIQETNGGDTSINYDTEMKAVTVTVAEGTVQTSVPTGAYTESDLGTGSTVTSSYGSGIGTYDFAVTGASKMGAFCINPEVTFSPNQTYPVVISPTNDQLSEGAQRTNSQSANSEISDVAAEMREALYWFYETGNTTITSDPYGKMQYYLRWLVGTNTSTSFSDADAETMRNTIKAWIADGHSVPSSFKLVLFSVTGQQPLVLGIYDSTGEDWTASQGNTPTFTNSTVELGDYSATIKAKKTLDGEVPTGKTFTFILKENGTEVDRQTSDANGNVTFTLNYTQTGTHTYTIEEYDDGQAGISYATNVETVTVNVQNGTNDELDAIESAIEDGKAFSSSYSYVGYTSSSGSIYTYTVTPTGGAATTVYSLDSSGYAPYNKVYTPAVSPSASQISAVTSASEENLKKLLYYFEQNPSTSATMKQGLMYTLADSDYYYSSTYSGTLQTILNTTTAPAGYTLVLYTTTSSSYPPLIAGFSMSGGTTVTYGGQTLTDTNRPTFDNTTTTYTMPETGGVGRTILYVVGGLLVAVPIAYIGYGLWRRRRKGGLDDN